MKCVPLQPPPKGVESAASNRRASSPFTVGYWNRTRDEDLRRVEALARDGMRLANAQLLSFAHVANSLRVPGAALAGAEMTQSLEMLRDITHAVGDHFIRIAEQSLQSRRSIALQAVGVADQARLLGAGLGTDLFGGEWPAAGEAETARRKRSAEQAALENRRGGPAKRARGRGNGGRGQGRWTWQPNVPSQAAPSQPQQWQQQQQPQQQQQLPFPGQTYPQPLMQVSQPPLGQQPGRGRGRRRNRQNRATRGRGQRARGQRRGAGRGGAAEWQYPSQY